jgi:predicted dehydrogenase
MRRLATRREWLAGAAATRLAAGQVGGGEPLRLPRKIRIGLIGLEGHYSEILDPLRRLPDAELVAVASNSPRALPKLESIHRYKDYREMLDRERLDIAAVCNTNGERAAAVLACVERKLHVAAEKPLATERADLERIKQAVSRTGVHLTMLLPMRFDPVYLAVKQAVDSGAIGEVAQIDAQKSYQANERPDWFVHHASYGGTIPWIGSHMVDLMRWSSGREFTEAVSFQSRVGFPSLGDMENVTVSLFRLDNGGTATLRMDYLRPSTAPTHGDDRLRLAGTKGVVEYQESTGVTVLTAGGPPQVIRNYPLAQSLFSDFLQSIYLGKAPALSLQDVYRVTEIVLLARESAERHQIVRL